MTRSLMSVHLQPLIHHQSRALIQNVVLCCSLEIEEHFGALIWSNIGCGTGFIGHT